MLFSYSPQDVEYDVISTENMVYIRKIGRQSIAHSRTVIKYKTLNRCTVQNTRNLLIRLNISLAINPKVTDILFTDAFSANNW